MALALSKQLEEEQIRRRAQQAQTVLLPDSRRAYMEPTFVVATDSDQFKPLLPLSTSLKNTTSVNLARCLSCKFRVFASAVTSDIPC
eukprot:6193070-Pleurochrysis_carterae.AAC.3